MRKIAQGRVFTDGDLERMRDRRVRPTPTRGMIGVPTPAARPYSALKHLARTVWGHGHDPHACWFMIYKVFYDASGAQTSQSGAMVVLGLASTEGRWATFTRKWERLLRDFDVPYFHMREYAHSRGPFASWKGDEARRTAFMRGMIDIIERRVNKVFASGVHMSAFHKVNAEYELAESYGSRRPDAGAYAFCAHTCHSMVEDWMETRHRGDRVSHVFERGDRGRGAFQTALFELGPDVFSSVSFLPKTDPVGGDRVRPFEAADLVAWEWRNLYATMLRDDVPERRSLYALVTRMANDEGFLDEPLLRELCDGYVPRRVN